MRSKIFYRLVLIILLSVSSSISVFADQITITEDSKKIFLKDDRTGEDVKEEPKKERLYDFRKTTWGMNKIQVKKTEKSKILMEDKDMLVYGGNVSGLDCIIIYTFIEGKLVRGSYTFTKTHTNKNDYISDYNDLKETLIKKYGKPIKDTHIWKNDLFRNDYQQWGFAISLGHLVYKATWEKSNTNILLILCGDNYEITHTLFYYSKELENLEEKAKEKKTLDEF